MLGIQISDSWRLETAVTTSVLFINEKEPGYILSLDTGLGFEDWGQFGEEYPFKYAAVTEQIGLNSREKRISLDQAFAFLRLKDPELCFLFKT